MKTRLYLLVIFIATCFSGFSQQIPNGSFETWVNAYTPVSWNGVEDIIGVIVPISGSIFTYKDTTTYTEGAASVKLVTDTVTGPYSSLIGITPGVMSLGTAYLDLAAQAPAFAGIPFTYRPDSIIFDYKQSTAGADSGGFKVTLTKKGVALLSSYPGSNGAAFQLHPDTGWTHVAICLDPYYINDAYPDTLVVQFVSSATNNPVVGTTMNIDGVRFGYVSQPLTVATSGSGVICPGDSVTLYANANSSNYGYQWKVGGVNITGATSASYTTADTGIYTVTIDSATSTATSQPIALVVDNSVALLPGLNDTVCNTTNAFLLEGSPAGGVYTGSGTTTSSFVPNSANLGIDTIIYVVNDMYGCTKSASATILVENCTGIEAIPSAGLSVYPNPATTLLNINSNMDLAGFNLKVYDVVGRLVTGQTLAAQSNVVNVAALAGGTYIYRISDKENNVITENKFNVVK